MKKEREQEEQRKLVLLELMELWKEAFHCAGDFLTLVIKYRITEEIPDNQPAQPPTIDCINMTDKMMVIGDKLRHQECKYFLYYGECEIYKGIKTFHNSLVWYGASISDYTIETQRAEHDSLHEERDKLVKLFREQLRLG